MKKKYSLGIIIAISIGLCCNDTCDEFQQEEYQEASIIEVATNEQKNEYKEYLRKLNEPIFDEFSHEGYRFILENLTDTSLLIRITHPASSPSLIIKKFVDFSGTRTRVLNEIEHEISESDWTALKEVLRNNDYWQLRSEIEKNIGLDGAIWMMEGIRPEAIRCRKRNHHYVQRWSPREGEFRIMADKFIEIFDNTLMKKQ